ncbi:MAG: sigma-70 family RNA polymerase sigma factor [bacterium]
MTSQMANLQLKPSTSDREPVLIKRSQSGDETAFGELYEIWAAKVYRFVYFRVKNVPTAEDLTSEIFLKAWQKIHQYKPQANIKFSSWLYTIARNSVIDYYRISRRIEISFEGLPEIADLEGSEPFAAELTLDKTLSQLPTEYEKVLRLRFVEELPIARIAQIMQKKESNIRILTYRALQKLKIELDK